MSLSRRMGEQDLAVQQSSTQPREEALMCAANLENVVLSEQARRERYVL